MLTFTNIAILLTIGAFYFWVFINIRLKPLLIAVLICVTTIVILTIVFSTIEIILHQPFQLVKFGDVLKISSIGSLEELTRAIMGVLFIKIVYNCNRTPQKDLKRIVFFVAVIYTTLETNVTLKYVIQLSDIANLSKPSNKWLVPLLGFGLLSRIFVHFLTHYFLFSLSLTFARRRMWIFLIVIVLYHGMFNIIMQLNPTTLNNVIPLYINLIYALVLITPLYIFIKKTKIGAVVNEPLPNGILEKRV